MKLIRPLLVTCLILLLLSCDDRNDRKGKIENYIPEDATTVVTLKSLENFRGDTNNNSFINSLPKPNLYHYFSEENAIFKHLRPTSKSIIAQSSVTDSTRAFTFITKETEGLFVPDSITNKTIETLAYNDLSLQRVTIDDAVTYMGRIDSVFIASSSQKVLESILKGSNPEDKTFQKIYGIKKNADVAVAAKNNVLALQDSGVADFASWSTMDMTITPSGITATGVALARDTVPQLLNIFKGQQPQSNKIASVIPTDAKRATLFTVSDAVALQRNIADFRNENSPISSNLIFDSFNEIGVIEMTDETVIVGRSIDPLITQEAIAPYSTEKTRFRDVRIYEFSEPSLFSEAFYPLVPKTGMVYVLQLDTFFVFTASEESANQMIIAYKNNDVLAKTTLFQEVSAKLGKSSSLLFYGLDEKLPSALNGFFTNSPSIANDKRQKGLSLKGIPLTVLQYTYDRDFAHINFTAEEIAERKEIAVGVSESLTITSDTEIAGNPIFFSNHRTNGQDVVFQDINNTLHFYADNGKKLWSKKLNGHILGKIQEVDLLRNGKMQLAFVTTNTFHVLDRNGNDVGAFPLQFKDAITQPLSVFDYDDNRQYRFLVTQNRNVLMYDSNAKRVNGFTFSKAGSTIVQPPKHIRTGNKDYILIAEENGKLNILNRRGQTRVKVSKNFSFSEVPVTSENRDFIVIDSKNTKHTITQTGKVSSQILDVSSSYWFTTSGNLKVTIDDNMLRINGALKELPFGIYTRPQLFIANNNYYITITETQEKKVYVYDRSGALLPGFPIFGISPVDIEEGVKKGTLLLLTKGDTNEIIGYVIQ